MMNFHGKKILFLSAIFFGYEKEIAKRLEELGAEVDFYNERPSDSIFTKGIIRVKKELYEPIINQYYKEIFKQTKTKNFDFLLLIKGESIPLEFLKKFKTRHPKAKMIFYSYDSVAEYPKFRKLYPYFDLNFTFEPKDAIAYHLHFRPLFFLNDYIVDTSVKKQKYALSFIGTAHTDRYLIVEKLQKICEKLNLKSFFYHYAPGKIAFSLRRIFDKNLQYFDFKKLNFQALTHAEIIQIYQQSFAILDINKPFQFGLSMRSFEVLASGRKLVTTNSDIINYPFFNKNNILIIDRNNTSLEATFFKTPFQSLDAEVLEKMSLDSFISCLFFENQDEYWGIKNWEIFSKS